MKLKYLAVILLISCTLPMKAQVAPDWGKFEYLTGKWVGEGSGQPGQGSGWFTFEKQLDGNILVRKNRTEFPATADRPASVHEDLLVIYSDYQGVPSKAIYWDNERHTIEYGVSFQDKAVVLTSAAIKGMPRFRLSYEPIDAKTVNVKFEMSSPDKTDEFKVYLEGKSKKQ